MTNADVVLAVVDWVEGRLTEDLPVPALAKKAGYSLHHFVRLFHGVVGMPPRDYVLRRKLSEAARELSRSRRTVTDVAFSYAFNDLETFTRAFRREFGTTPSAVRRGAPFAYTGRRAAVRPAAPIGITEPPVLEPSASFRLAGWSIRVYEETDAVGKLWARFLPRAATIRNAPVPPRFRQLASWTEDGDDGIDIMTGVEVPDFSDLPIDLVGKSVPGCDCLVFTHRGPVTRIGDSYRGIYERWLPASDRRPALPFNFERYRDGVGDPYADSYVFEICVPVA
jgi:AraC family transcriptional regulator